MVRLILLVLVLVSTLGCAMVAKPETTPRPPSASTETAGEHAGEKKGEAAAPVRGDREEHPREGGQKAKPPEPAVPPPPPPPAPAPAPEARPRPSPPAFVPGERPTHEGGLAGSGSGVGHGALSPPPAPPPRAPETASPEEESPPAGEGEPSLAPPAAEEPEPPSGTHAKPPLAASEVPVGLPMLLMVGLLSVGVLLCVMIAVIAVIVPSPTGFQYMVFRTNLAVGAACVAAAISGYVNPRSGVLSTAGMVGGGVGVFLMVYLIDPVSRLGKKVGRPGRSSEEPRAPDESIFISYRHGDVVEAADRLHEKLVERYGDPAVFKDVEDIGLGVDFRDVLRRALRRCKVVIAVIGPEWESLVDKRGARKLDDPRDPLRLEIETALERKLTLIPVLVHRTGMPDEERLPRELRDVVYRNFIVLRPDPDFANDVERLVRDIDRCLADA